MFDITKVNWKKLESKRFQARMLRTCTQIVQQQFFAQKTVL